MEQVALPLSFGTDVHLVLRALRELDLAVAQGEQGVVLAATDVLARMDVRAALANDDVARVHLLAAEQLHAETLRVGIAAVTAGTETFLCAMVFPPYAYSASSDAGLSAALAGAGFFSASSFFAAFLTAGFSALAEPTDSIWTRVSCWRWPRSFL